MEKKNLYVDVHVLQTVPPSCINRDDTGSPKTAVYGGVMRSRVSSQAWKYAMRQYFGQHFDESDLGYRTRNVCALVADKIRDISEIDDAEKKAFAILKEAGVDLKDENCTKALFFMSDKQAKMLAEEALKEIGTEIDSEKKTKKTKKKKDESVAERILKENPSYDIGLFGRMVANKTAYNFDAAAQVAHSISTHAVHNEYDYFTAVDDYQDEDQSGSAHIDTTEFNSSTLYRYATVNVRELKKNFSSDETIEIVKGFVQAFIYSMPTGKQNSFANRTLPDMVYVAVREDQPVNMVGAFEKPVKPSKDGYIVESEKVFSEYAEKTYNLFAERPTADFITCLADDLECSAEKMSVNNMLQKIEDQIRNCY